MLRDSKGSVDNSDEKADAHCGDTLVQDDLVPPYTGDADSL